MELGDEVVQRSVVGRKVGCFRIRSLICGIKASVHGKSFAVALDSPGTRMSTMLVVVRVLLSTASIAERSESGCTTMTLTGLCSLTARRGGEGQKRAPNEPNARLCPQNPSVEGVRYSQIQSHQC